VLFLWPRKNVAAQHFSQSQGADAPRTFEKSGLAAQALSEYLVVNEWQIAGVKQAVASLDRGEGVPHDNVKEWVDSWGSENERSTPAHFSKA